MVAQIDTEVACWEVALLNNNVNSALFPCIAPRPCNVCLQDYQSLVLILTFWGRTTQMIAAGR